MQNNDRPYGVVDTHTGKIVWRGTRYAIARRVRDRRDNQYGGYRYRIQSAPEKTK